MKIWHISDTHEMHDQLKVPDGIDMVIHSGDMTNSRRMDKNSVELWPFIDWFKSLPISHKVLIAGNHDSAIEGRMLTQADWDRWQIHYLENNWVEISGHKIWGSPVTPQFNNWCFMMSRDKTHKVWDIIPNDTDIVVTHGPPQGILDLTKGRSWTNEAGDFVPATLEQVGCRSLAKRMEKLQPKLHCFGHIHDFKEIKNSGLLKVSGQTTMYSNAACVEDSRFREGLKHKGNIISL